MKIVRIALAAITIVFFAASCGDETTTEDTMMDTVTVPEPDNTLTVPPDTSQPVIDTTGMDTNTLSP